MTTGRRHPPHTKILSQALGCFLNKLFRLAKRAGRLPRLPGGAEFEMEYKNTLNLPQTDFPMRAGLVQREPERLAKWYADSLYEQIQKVLLSGSCRRVEEL